MVCECPDGYVADEKLGCITLSPIVTGCERDDDCADKTACINSLCTDPCACGSHANCEIVNHRPVCICEKGYYGNPEIACVQVGCQSDSECKETHACRSGSCTPGNEATQFSMKFGIRVAV